VKSLPLAKFIRFLLIPLIRDYQRQTAILSAIDSIAFPYMKYFIGIAPPDDVKQKIEALRAGWGPASIEPHITVKAPNSLNDSLAWLPRVAALCSAVAPFSIQLQGIGQFGTSVLYLRVVSDEIAALHQALVRIADSPLAEQAAFFEGVAYRPHLTLAHAKHGGSLSPAVAAMLPQVAEAWAQPIGFLATAIRIYRSNGGGHGYDRYLELPLLGKVADI
jgi:2'-5' RNA ligase